MRYSTSHKDQTRQRIIDAASLLFKENGIDATGIAVIMKQAKLTNGAFYAHFASKEALVEASIADQVQKQLESFQEAPNDMSGVKLIIDTYLSTGHRDSCGLGCPSAALLDEIARRSDATKRAYSSGMTRLADSFKGRFAGYTEEQVREKFTGLFALLVGTLQLSRAMADQHASDFVLSSGRKAAYSLAGVV